MNDKLERLLMSEKLPSSFLPAYDVDQDALGLVWDGDDGFDFKMPEKGRIVLGLYESPSQEKLRVLIGKAINKIIYDDNFFVGNVPFTMMDEYSKSPYLSALMNITDEIERRDMIVNGFLMNPASEETFQRFQEFKTFYDRVPKYMSLQIPDGVIVALADPEFLGYIVEQDGKMGLILHNPNAVSAGLVSMQSDVGLNQYLRLNFQNLCEVSDVMDS